MIDDTTYRQRRDQLRRVAGDGIILLLGHRPAPRNYRDNTYPFRQNSHVLYYSGISRPGVALIIGRDPAGDVLYGPPEEIDDVVWYGPHQALPELGAHAGVNVVRDVASLGALVAEAVARRERVHYLPPYRSESREWLAALLGLPAGAVDGGASKDLVRAVAAQRSVKSDDEVAEIEEALGVTRAMHVAAMNVARPGMLEAEVAAAVQSVAIAKDRAQAYNPIVTIHGEVLHNEAYHHRLEAGQLLLNDSGAESPLFYASDITRTFPVSGRFSPEQRAIYQVVLDAQLAAIAAIAPGVRYRDVHLRAARSIVVGLKGVGLMRGDTENAVAAGAHALFFPHGIGHLLGLDVHDLEDLGDIVGYPEGEARSPQFGLNYLRLAKALEPGFVVTVEPGIYFIPALIDRWQAEGRHREFIDYPRLAAFRGLGGIRIEDDVLCTSSGGRVLGPPIPKLVAEVESMLGSR